MDSDASNEMESSDDEMNRRDGERSWGIYSTDKSMLEEKIEVVQNVLTVLETTMSSANLAHQKKEQEYTSQIDTLQEQIDKLKSDRNTEEKRFQDETKALENSIQKFIASENKLRTVEERSQDDYVVLPELDSQIDDIVQHYSEHPIEWDRMKRKCQKLNRDTQQMFSSEVMVRRFKLTSPFITSPQFQKAMNAANALNACRGKKIITGNQRPDIEFFVTMTCYKNAESAVKYVEKYHEQILKDVFLEKYGDKSDELVITELNDPEVGNEFNPATMMESTIHVQAKTSTAVSAPSMPRRITLYQFDEDLIRETPPQVTTFEVESARIMNYNYIDSGPISGRISPPPLPPCIPSPNLATTRDILQGSQDNSNNNTSRPFWNQQLISKKTSKILNMVGLGDDSEKHSKDKTKSSDAARTPPQQRPSSSSAVAPLAIPSTSSSISRKSYTYNIDGVALREWAAFYANKHGIETFTDTQKRLIKAFEEPNDIMYKGVTNSGKTLATIVGLINRLDATSVKPQALIVTPNPRSSKLIQKVASFESERHKITCSRFEELLVRGSKSKNTTFTTNPSCQIVVGTPEEICQLSTKGGVQIDEIHYLVLYKVDEIVGPESVRKSLFTNIRKILYTLNATIKVIVVRKSNAPICKEMQEICETKLRNKTSLEETISMAEYLHDRSRGKTMECDGDQSNIESCQIQEVILISSSSDEDKSSSTTVGGAKPNSDIIPESTKHLKLELAAAHHRTRQISTSETPHYHTHMTLLGAKLLGFQVAPQLQDTEDFNKVTVTHFYAKIEDGTDNSKADIISMLDLEEDKAIIFCNTSEKAEWLSAKLRQRQLWPQVLHEGVTRQDERAILRSFRQGSMCRLLICTDFLLNISLDSADIILNFEIPETSASYMNRSAFAFRKISSESDKEPKGIIVSLITNDQMESVRKLEQALGITINSCAE